MVVVTIGGPPGAGSTSAAKAVAEDFGLQFLSTGTLFRQVAVERGLNVEDLSGTAEKEVDLEVDNRTKEEAAKGNVVIESKLAAWVVRDAGIDAIKIWLTAPVSVRAQRIAGDEKQRIAESPLTIEDAEAKIRKREEEDRNRLLECYGYDMYDTSVYDLVLDTGLLALEQTKQQVLDFIHSKID